MVMATCTSTVPQQAPDAAHSQVHKQIKSRLAQPAKCLRAAKEPVDQVSTANAALQAFPTQKASLATLNSEGVTHMHSPKDSSLTLSGNSHQGQSCSADVKAQFAVDHGAVEVKA